jgi:uncharacterized protein YecE (DUF72 family)
MQKEAVIGCCGFAEAQSRYFAEFKAIEIQQTFYEPPKLETAQRWRAAAPPDFEFSLKAWQLITHPATSPTYRRLRRALSEKEKPAVGYFQSTEEVWQAWQITREIAMTLRARFIVFQCPASFGYAAENVRRMRDFFKKLDRADFALVWESRGNWPGEKIRQLCEELDLIDGVDPFQRLPQSRHEVRYFRLHGIGGYGYRYSDRDLEKLCAWCNGKLNWIMFNNKAMLEDARRFRALEPSHTS